MVRVVCSQFGTVYRVSLHLYPCAIPNVDPIAIVEMSSPLEADTVNRLMGRGSFGAGIVIPIVQSPRLERSDLLLENRTASVAKARPRATDSG